MRRSRPESGVEKKIWGRSLLYVQKLMPRPSQPASCLCIQQRVVKGQPKYMRFSCIGLCLRFLRDDHAPRMCLWQRYCNCDLRIVPLWENVLVFMEIQSLELRGNFAQKSLFWIFQAFVEIDSRIVPTSSKNILKVPKISHCVSCEYPWPQTFWIDFLENPRNLAFTGAWKSEIFLRNFSRVAGSRSKTAQPQTHACVWGGRDLLSRIWDRDRLKKQRKNKEKKTLVLTDPFQEAGSRGTCFWMYEAHQSKGQNAATTIFFMKFLIFCEKITAAWGFFFRHHVNRVYACPRALSQAQTWQVWVFSKTSIGLERPGNAVVWECASWVSLHTQTMVNVFFVWVREAWCSFENLWMSIFGIYHQGGLRMGRLVFSQTQPFAAKINIGTTCFLINFWKSLFSEWYCRRKKLV